MRWEPNLCAQWKIRRVAECMCAVASIQKYIFQQHVNSNAFHEFHTLRLTKWILLLSLSVSFCAVLSSLFMHCMQYKSVQFSLPYFQHSICSPKRLNFLWIFTQNMWVCTLYVLFMTETEEREYSIGQKIPRTVHTFELDPVWIPLNSYFF